MVSGRGIACVAYEGDNGYAALVAEVDVDLQTGTVRPKRFVIALDCGRSLTLTVCEIRPKAASCRARAGALVEEVKWDSRRVTSFDWETLTLAS